MYLFPSNCSLQLLHTFSTQKLKKLLEGGHVKNVTVINLEVYKVYRKNHKMRTAHRILHTRQINLSVYLSIYVNK